MFRKLFVAIFDAPPNGPLHLRLRLRDLRGPQRDRRSRQVEAMLGEHCSDPNTHDKPPLF
jgi:hypothetical protein